MKKNVFYATYKEHADLIGKIARCSKGDLALITGRSTLPLKNRTSWIGIPLNHPGKWSARNPVIVANTLLEYLAACVKVHTYIFARTQIVKVSMAADGEEYEGEPVEWANLEAQRDGAREWAEQTFMDEDYCEDFMEVETTDWKLQDPLPPKMSPFWLRGGKTPDESITK